MALRCGCYDQADDIVFGPNHQCTSKPAMLAEPATLPSLVPSWRFVVPESEPVLRDRWDMDDDERRGT